MVKFNIFITLMSLKTIFIIYITPTENSLLKDNISILL